MKPVSHKNLRSVCLGVFAILIVACGGPGTPYEWNLPYGFPEPIVPEDNPMTNEKVALGRQLFFDTRLSGNGKQSCASCHQANNAFTETRARTVGSTGETHTRNTMALVNVAYNSTLTWAHPELTRIEQQLLIPMFGDAPVELGISGNEERVLDRFRQDESYRHLFDEAFSGGADAINFDNIVKALASYVRSLVSVNSRFDRYAYGTDDSALSEPELRGLNLFLSERLECHHCHGGFNFTQSTTHEDTSFLERPFHNTGLYNVNGEGAYPDRDRGVMDVTGDNADMGRFRAPTLRNIALTAPYMHDGSLATLDDVVNFYSTGGRVIPTGVDAGDGRSSPLKNVFVKGFELDEQERADLIAFLGSLTDERFLEAARHADPFSQ